MRLQEGYLKTTAMASRLDDGIPFLKESLILMADDDIDYHLIAQCALIEVGFRGILAGVSNGVELLDYLYRRKRYQCASKPDLIILDLNMPEIDGRSCLREIKGEESLSHIPVAVLTASTRNRDIELCKRFRRCTYSIKPISFDEWVCTIGWVLREHLPLTDDDSALADTLVDATAVLE